LVENIKNVDRTELGRKLFTQPCAFLRGVGKLEDLSSPELPEVAFIGRSNCGKSSLLNALTGRKSLARTSKTPGRTKQLNFFDLGQKVWLVDMPGYGYAKASKKEIMEWNKTVQDYLKGRPTLLKLCLLIDSRRGIKPNDIEIMKLLDKAAVSYRIVLTKVDKIGNLELEDLINSCFKILKLHPAAFPEPIPTSSLNGEGIPQLRAEIAIMIQEETK
tara:strand:- start:28835 stop:29485 length:651 start_codon:yes stop_codon:yes gene_type:complete